MSKSIIALVVAVLSIPALAASANAAPAGLGATKPSIAADAAATTTQVHWTKRHHAKRYYRNSGPSVKLYVGPGRRHYRHHRRWKHHD